MKKIAMIALVMVAAFALTTNAQMLSEGTQEVYGSAAWDFETPGGSTGYGITAGYGYYVMDNVMAVGDVTYLDNDNADGLYALRAGAEYNFPMDGMLVPYVAGLVGYEKLSDDAVEDSALTLAVRPGVKYYLSDAVALDVGFDFTYATEDIYVNDGKADDLEYGLTARVRAAF